MTSEEIIILKREFEEQKKLLLEIKSSIDALSDARMRKPLDIKEVQKMGVIGGYDRIKSLIKKGHLKVTGNGKITYESLTNYLNGI